MLSEFNIDDLREVFNNLVGIFCYLLLKFDFEYEELDVSDSFVVKEIIVI